MNPIWTYHVVAFPTYKYLAKATAVVVATGMITGAAIVGLVGYFAELYEEREAKAKAENQPAVNPKFVPSAAA